MESHLHQAMKTFTELDAKPHCSLAHFYLAQSYSEQGQKDRAKNAKTIEGDPCYPDLNSIEGGVDGVLIVTRPEVTEKIVAQCVEAKVPRVWMHRSFKFLGNSISESAVQTCIENGITVIPGACPMMYLKPVDFPHLGLRETLRLIGGLPKPISGEKER
jgi:hypothetical protein